MLEVLLSQVSVTQGTRVIYVILLLLFPGVYDTWGTVTFSCAEREECLEHCSNVGGRSSSSVGEAFTRNEDTRDVSGQPNLTQRASELQSRTVDHDG